MDAAHAFGYPHQTLRLGGAEVKIGAGVKLAPLAIGGVQPSQPLADFFHGARNRDRFRVRAVSRNLIHGDQRVVAEQVMQRLHNRRIGQHAHGGGKGRDG